MGWMLKMKCFYVLDHHVILLNIETFTMNMCVYLVLKYAHET